MNGWIRWPLEVAIWIWTGCAVMVLWGWFMVPLGLPAIDLAHAIGVSLLIRLITFQVPTSEPEIGWEAAALFVQAALPLVSLVLGFIARCFM